MGEACGLKQTKFQLTDVRSEGQTHGGLSALLFVQTKLSIYTPKNLCGAARPKLPDTTQK